MARSNPNPAAGAYLRCGPEDAHLGALARPGGVGCQAGVGCVPRRPGRSEVCDTRRKNNSIAFRVLQG